MFLWIRHLQTRVSATWKQGGLKALFREFGWKMFAVIFIYYLIRDVTLYILLPLFAYRALSP
jgi:hypothetical protein